MKERLRSVLVGLALSVVALLWVGEASAADYMLYFHGRSMKSWPNGGLANAPPGWNHIVSTYGGSKRMDSDARTTVKTMLKTYCRGSNNCAIVCYSAGCARMLLGFDDLKQEGTPANNVYWIEAPASAAGGTEAAEYTTKWWKKLLAKVLGAYAPIDKDLSPAKMRGTYGFMQNRAPASMYHSAGKKNICKSFLFGLFRICGNSALPGGNGDGAVPLHSACGYADEKSHTGCCDGSAKFTNRSKSDCAAQSLDHAGMLGFGLVQATERLGRTTSFSTSNFPNNTSGLTDCNRNHDDCDGWMKTTEKTLSQILNVTPPDEDKDGKPDNCIEVDHNSCAMCKQFSILEAAYGDDCNLWSGTKTLGGGENSGWQKYYFKFTSHGRPSSTEIRFSRYNDGDDITTSMTLKNNVTVSVSGDTIRTGAQLTNVEIASATKLKLNFRWYLGDGDYGYGVRTWTFSSNVELKRAHDKSFVDEYNSFRDYNWVRWDGNQLFFVYGGKSCSDCYSSPKAMGVVVLHENDANNDGT